MRAGAIADAARALGADSVSEHDDVGRSVRAAAQAQDSLTVVTGSLYVAAEALPVARALAGKT
jgi:folylpolyglutamate synthase/dihydropteroate synthase